MKNMNAAIEYIREAGRIQHFNPKIGEDIIKDIRALEREVEKLEKAKAKKEMCN